MLSNTQPPNLRSFDINFSHQYPCENAIYDICEKHA